MSDFPQLFTVTPPDVGKRLDVFLAQVLSLTRSRVLNLIKEGSVQMGERVSTKPAERVRDGSVISVSLPTENAVPEPEVGEQTREPFPPIEILTETDDYIVFNKPAGLLVHETEAHEPVTLVAWLLQKYPALQDIGDNPTRPGIVHRLDKDASGVLIVAKTQAMFGSLKQQFHQRTIAKEYQVLVHGVIEADEGTIDFIIDRGTEGRMVARPKVDPLKLESVTQVQEGKEALTTFVVLKRFVNYTLLSVRIHTGRTHQIRVHFYAYNHPVVGDTVYFQKKLAKFNKGIARLFLYASRLSFTDLSGERIEVVASLPQELEEFLEKLKV